MTCKIMPFPEEQKKKQNTQMYTLHTKRQGLKLAVIFRPPTVWMTSVKDKKATEISKTNKNKTVVTVAVFK